jgi:8-oxo-dGTP pyrophosphatase MutT (NUDIX family)
LNGQAEEPPAGDQGRQNADGLPAAVLVGLVNRPEGPTILLTKRTEHLRDHAGQICFPGGRIEPDDASVEAAALREAEEEIGLAPSRVDIISRLAPYDTVTGFRIHPVVGWIEPPLSFKLDAFEVAEVFELPLSFVLDSRNHQRQQHQRSRTKRSYYVLPYEGRFIWGATAGMLVIFANLLRC